MMNEEQRKARHATKFVKTPPAKIGAIKTRLAGGQSARRIAKEERVSQDTVALVRHGLWEDRLEDLVEPVNGRVVDPYRCVGCGKTVRHWPCVVCRTIEGSGQGTD